METFNTAIRQAADSFFGGSLPTCNQHPRSYSVSWATCPGTNPPPNYVLRDFFEERGFDPEEVVVSSWSCFIFFALDTINQEC